MLSGENDVSLLQRTVDELEYGMQKRSQAVKGCVCGGGGGGGGGSTFPPYTVYIIHSDVSYPGTLGPGTARISDWLVSQDNSSTMYHYHF